MKHHPSISRKDLDLRVEDLEEEEILGSRDNLRCHNARSKKILATKCNHSSLNRKRIEVFYLLFILTSASAALFTLADHQHQQNQLQVEGNRSTEKNTRQQLKTTATTTTTTEDDWTRSASDALIAADADADSTDHGHYYSSRQAADTTFQRQQQAADSKLLPAGGEHSAVKELADDENRNSSSGDDFGLSELSLDSADTSAFEPLKLGESNQNSSSQVGGQTTSSFVRLAQRRSLDDSSSSTSNKPAFTSSSSDDHDSWSLKNSTAANIRTNEQLLSSTRDSINRTSSAASFADQLALPSNFAGTGDEETDGSSSELIGAHNYMHFGAESSQPSELLQQQATVLPPTRNLNASLEAQAKLKDAMIQLHYNKTLAFEKMNSSQLPPPLVQDQTNLLPSYEQQHPSASGSSQSEQFVSVSPTQEPSSRIEWIPKEAPAARATVQSGGDLLEAAGEIHQHRNKQKHQADESSSVSGDWGQRKSASGAVHAAAAAAAAAAADKPNDTASLADVTSDLITWTPTSGPAAYKAGSSAAADFMGPLATNGSDQSSAVDYSEQANESRHSFEMRSRPSQADLDAANETPPPTSKPRRKQAQFNHGGLKRMTKVTTKPDDVRQQPSGDDELPVALHHLGNPKQRTKKVVVKQSTIGRPLVELPKAPPPDPELTDEDTVGEQSPPSDESPTSYENELASENNQQEDQIAAPIKAITQRRPQRQPVVTKVRLDQTKSQLPAKRRQNVAKIVAAEKDIHDGVDIPQPETKDEIADGQEETSSSEVDDQGEPANRHRNKIHRSKLRQKQVMVQQSQLKTNRRKPIKTDQHQEKIKWSPQTSFTGDDETNKPSTNQRQSDTNQQEASFAMGTKAIIDEGQPDDETSDGGKEEEQVPTRYLLDKGKQHVSGAAVDTRSKPPVIRTFRVAEQTAQQPEHLQPSREYSPPAMNVEQQQPRDSVVSESFVRNHGEPPMQHTQKTQGGFSPQSSLPATLIGRPALNNYQRLSPQQQNHQYQQHQQYFSPEAQPVMRPPSYQRQSHNSFNTRPFQNAIMTSSEPYNEAAASSNHQHERFHSFSSMMNPAARYQVQPQPVGGNNNNNLNNNFARTSQNQNDSAWSIVTFPYPQQQQEQQQPYRPSQPLIIPQAYSSFHEHPQSGRSSAYETNRRVPTTQYQDGNNNNNNNNNRPEQQSASFIYHMPAPQLGDQTPSQSLYSQPAPSGLMSQQADSTQILRQHQSLPSRVQQPPSNMLIQRGIRQAPMSSSQLPPLTIRLDTRNEYSQSSQSNSNQQQHPKFNQESSSSNYQQQPTPLPKIPPSNGHLPPPLTQQQQAHDEQLPAMRRPMSSFLGNRQDYQSSSRTNGHAYAGQPKLPHMGVAPSAWLHHPYGDDEFISPQFGAASEYSALFEGAGSGTFFPMPSSLFDNNQQMLMAAAMPASVFMAPHDPNSQRPKQQQAQSQFVKKGTSGITPISAALPLATPAKVRDAFGWPMGYGSEAAKTLLKVNHVAPPPAYLIPDKVSEAQANALMQPTMIEPSSSKGKPPRVTPLQEDPSFIQVPKGNNNNNNNAWPVMGQHSMLRPQIVWPSGQHASASVHQPLRANVIQVALSTRPPAKQAPFRRAKFWQRLRAPFSRHRSSPSSSQSDHTESQSDRPQTLRIKRGIVDQMSKLVTLGRRNKPPTANNTKTIQHQPSRLALIEFGNLQNGPSEQAFIPMIDNGHLLENDILNQALAYNSKPSSNPESSRDDPMMISSSGLVPSFSPLQSQAHPNQLDLESAVREQQQLSAFVGGAANGNNLEPQQFYVPASLEPPANEPPGKSSDSSKQGGGVKKAPTSQRLRQSISRSLSKPLSRIKSIGTRWFSPSSNSSATKQQSQQHKSPVAASSQIQPQVMSVAQQLNSIMSPSVMMSSHQGHHVSSLENFNQFAIPIHQYWLRHQQQQQHSGLSHQHQGPPLFPLATHASQSMSPFTFVVEKNRMNPDRNISSGHSIMNPMAAATNGRPMISWQEPPSIAFGAQQVAAGDINNNLRRSEYEQYLAPPMRQELQQPRHHKPMMSMSSSYSARPAIRPPPLVRHHLRPSPRMQQGTTIDLQPATTNNNQTQVSHRPLPTKVFIREPPRQQQQQQLALRQHRPQPQHQEQIFADLTPSQLDSLAQATEFIQDDSMMQSLMTSASNSIQADSPKVETVPQTTGDFTPLTSEQQQFQQQPGLSQMGQPILDNSQQPYYQQSYMQAELAGQRPRLPRLLPSINSMASKFRQHLYQTFRFNQNYPLLTRKPPSFDSSYISPSYVSYPSQSSHFNLQQPQQLSQQPQQPLLSSAPTTYVAQSFAAPSPNYPDSFSSNQLQRPPMQHMVRQQQHQPGQQAIVTNNAISTDEHEIVYEAPSAPAEFTSANGTQLIQVQPSDSGEPGQVVEMYEQVIDPNPNSIQQVQQQQHQSPNSTRVQYAQATQMGEESNPSDGNHLNHDVNLVTSDGTYIQEEKETIGSGSNRVNIDELRNKSNITVHHHHIIEDGQQQHQPQQAQYQQAEQQQDEQQMQQQQQHEDVQPINGSVIETTHRQHHYEPERIQVRQPPRVQLVQVDGRRAPPGRQIKSSSQFVNRPNSTSASSSDRADYQIIRASSTSLGQQQPRSRFYSTNADDADSQPSVFVKLINGTVVEPITSPATALDSSSSNNDDHESVQHQTVVYERPPTSSTTSSESNESDQQQQAGQGELYEPTEDDRRHTSSSSTISSQTPVYESANRTLEYDLTPVNTTVNDYLSNEVVSSPYLPSSSNDIARNYSQPIGLTLNSSAVADTTTTSGSVEKEQQQHGDHYVIVDQPVIIRPSEPQQQQQQQLSNQTTASSQYEPPMVFVSTKPEKVIKEINYQPFRANSNELNRKRPLKKPKGNAGQTKLRAPALTTSPSELDSEKASELSASHSSAQNETTRYSVKSTTTTSSPAVSTLKPRHRNHNFRVNLVQQQASVGAPTERPPMTGAGQTSSTRAPKSRIRWQGANGRLSASNNINQTELSSSETSRREQAWIVSSMTHQAYSNQLPPHQVSNVSEQQQDSVYSSRTHPIEAVTLAPHFNDSLPVVDQRTLIKQQNSSYLGEPIRGNNNSNNITVIESAYQLNSTEQQFAEQPLVQSSQRIYANYGSAARTNSSSNSRRHALTEPRGRFQTFKSTLTRSNSTRSPATTTVAPDSDSASWTKSRESRTAPTSFRMSSASISTATSQQPALQQQQAAPMVDVPASTTPLTSVDSPLANEFSVRSDVASADQVETATSGEDDSDDLEAVTTNSPTDQLLTYNSSATATTTTTAAAATTQTPTTTTTSTSTTTTTTIKPAVDDSMAWLTASLDDTREDRLASTSNKHNNHDLAQQTTAHHLAADGADIAGADLQIKISPSSSEMISFSQLRHTND